jgi:hypothetical protein
VAARLVALPAVSECDNAGWRIGRVKMTEGIRKGERRKGPVRKDSRRVRKPAAIVSTRSGDDRRSKDRRTGSDRRQGPADSRLPLN